MKTINEYIEKITNDEYLNEQLNKLDLYLSSDLFIEVLERYGFNNSDEKYISNDLVELKVNKNTGKLTSDSFDFNDDLLKLIYILAKRNIIELRGDDNESN